MHQARRRAVAVFAQRIVGLARRAHELAGDRNDRPPQRLLRVVRGRAGSCSTA